MFARVNLVIHHELIGPVRYEADHFVHAQYDNGGKEKLAAKRREGKIKSSNFMVSNIFSNISYNCVKHYF
jgi:hypothetical protein